MARIAGIVLPAQDPEGEVSVRNALTASLYEFRTAGVAVEKTDRAVFGCCSNAAPSIAHRAGVVAVVDGTFYNAEELGRCDCDAMLLIDLYRRAGFQAAVSRLNGVFAVALYDQHDQTLWLARDRFGVKPLYYSASGDRCAFASTPRALRTMAWISSDVNRDFVARFAGLHYRYFDNDPKQSPYVRIAQLPPAHIARVADGRVTLSVYWTLDDRSEWTEPEETLAERYRELLFDAVRIRLRGVRSAAYTLSGGMDSSSILASAVAITGQRQRAFSAVYVDPTYDESDDIRTMLDATVDDWRPIAVVTPDVFGLVRRMVAVHDEPVATATWLSHFVVCEQAASAGIDALFGGLGGDELNAGEYEHFIYHFADLRSAGDEEQLAREVERWVAYHDHAVFRKSAAAAEMAFARTIDWNCPGRCRVDRARFDRYLHAVRRDYVDLSKFAPVMEHPFTSYLKNRTYQDLTRETIPCCLRAEDRDAAAFGLDRRLPFLDYRLVEFMFRVPGHYKIRNGISKHLLRRAMTGVLPEETRTRIKKTGWNAPAHRWFSGKGREALLDLVHSHQFRERGIYDQAVVCRVIDEHQRVVSSGEPAENHMMFLWQLVNLELWLQEIGAP